MSIKLAPLLLIAFNRPIHFKKTLLALCQNQKAKESILYISIDGPRNEEDKKLQEQILDHIKLAEGFFAHIKVLKNDTNKGLAKNIIESVSKVLSSHNKIIVLEDDLITSRAFINYMNDALTFYQNKKNVWHISGYSPINNKNKKDDIFLSRIMYCWGWATWNDRWINYNSNPSFLMNTFSKEMIYKFNLNGVIEAWDEVIENKIGKIQTWAIFWYSSIFTNNGLCVVPWFSYVKNIGLDGSGTHCNKIDTKMDINLNNELHKFKGIDNLVEDKKGLKIIQKSIKRSLLKKYIIKIITYLIGYYNFYRLKTLLKSRI